MPSLSPSSFLNSSKLMYACVPVIPLFSEPRIFVFGDIIKVVLGKNSNLNPGEAVALRGNTVKQLFAGENANPASGSHDVSWNQLLVSSNCEK